MQKLVVINYTLMLIVNLVTIRAAWYLGSALKGTYKNRFREALKVFLNKDNKT